MCQLCTGPPPSLHSYIGWLRNFHEIFVKFWISSFLKFSLNFAKLKIKKFREIMKTKILQPPFVLLHNLPSATHTPLLSAQRFFNVARQCYFEMKTNKKPYFSFLSSIILKFFHCLKGTFLVLIFLLSYEWSWGFISRPYWRQWFQQLYVIPGFLVWFLVNSWISITTPC